MIVHKTFGDSFIVRNFKLKETKIQVLLSNRHIKSSFPRYSPLQTFPPPPLPMKVATLSLKSMKPHAVERFEGRLAADRFLRDHFPQELILPSTSYASHSPLPSKRDAPSPAPPPRHSSNLQADKNINIKGNLNFKV